MGCIGDRENRSPGYIFYMRKGTIRLLIVTLILLLCSGVIYVYAHRHYVNSALGRRYQDGLRTARVYTNPFCPEAKLAHDDSLLLTKPAADAPVIQFLKASHLL